MKAAGSVEEKRQLEFSEEREKESQPSSLVILAQRGSGDGGFW